MATENSEAIAAADKTVEQAEAKVETKAPSGDTTKEEAPEADDPITAKTKKLNLLKTNAVADDKNWGNNIKSDPKKLPESNDPAEIRKQVEFYFKNSNLPWDKYLWKITGGPENKPVPIKEMRKFGRMHRFRSYDAIVAALRESDLLEVVDDEKDEGAAAIKRKVPYKMGDRKKEHEACIVYVKGFGDEEPTTQFDLEAWFTTFFHVDQLRLRREENKLFKGSVFVEFSNAEDARAFVALDPPPKWRGNDLLILSKSDYVSWKQRGINEGHVKPSNNKPPRKFFEGKDGGSFKDRRRPDSDNWKERREQDQRKGFRPRRGGGRGGGHHDRRGDGQNGSRRSDVMPKVHATTADGKKVENASSKGDQETPVKDTKTEDSKNAAATGNGKRAREDDNDSGEREAKKVDAEA